MVARLAGQKPQMFEKGDIRDIFYVHNVEILEPVA